MEVELKKKWVAALRSGEYEQTHGTLRSGYGKHCALGVLCEVGKRSTGAGAYDWLDSVLGGAGQTNEVWHWNDVDGLSFPELADRIEEHF